MMTRIDKLTVGPIGGGIRYERPATWVPDQ
jgi:hypothetical protein